MMKTTILSLFLACSLSGHAQVTDRVLLGNSESEQSHGLLSYCPDYTTQTTGGLLGQSGRNCLKFDGNPFVGSYTGIYGGEYCFVLRVDGSRQNYLTLRTNGGDAVKAQERYRVQVDNLDLQHYDRSAVSFSSTKAPGAFAFNTLTIPRKVTDGKTAIVVRVRSVGRYWGYAAQGNFSGYQRAIEADLPPIYAIYSSTSAAFSLNDEAQGTQQRYEDAKDQTPVSLEALKSQVSTTLNAAMRSQVEGYDFKPAYNNNNFNIVLGMGMAYQKGYFGTTSTALSNKIKAAIDSMVYINNLVKGGADITRSVLGQTATLQSATSGWGGLFGQQGLGFYLLWKAGKVTNIWLNKSVDLGNGESKRRDQWITAFKESFLSGCTFSGRRQITNQTMESALTVYGAALALYALDQQTYHNAPKLALRFMQEAAGLVAWTGVPVNCEFDGSITDAEGYPDYQLGDSTSTDTRVNNWGINFFIHTHKGNGRETGWTCTSCYGNSGPRLCDMYLATLFDPYIGTAEGGKGDEGLLQMAVNNAKSQAYMTYPVMNADGYKEIRGESAICYRNRYDSGSAYYNHLVVAALSGDEELMGHVWQGYQQGHLDIESGYTNKLFPYTLKAWYMPELIDKLIEFGKSHSSDYQPMPSTPGQPDYVFGDEMDGIVAIQHGTDHIFVNFHGEYSLSKPGMAHIITATENKTINFVPEVMKYTPSGHTETMPMHYWSGAHQIAYPDDPIEADGGTVYDIPAYDKAGHYNSGRGLCQYYQNVFDKYLVAQNCSETDSYALDVTDGLNGLKAVNVATGESVVISSSITLKPQTTLVLFINDLTNASEVTAAEKVNADVTALKNRVAELVPFSQDASKLLSDEDILGYYKTSAFMPFFKELTMADFIANNGTSTQAEVDSMLTVLNAAYEAFAGQMTTIDACAVPGQVAYTKKLGTSGSVTVKNNNSILNAKNGSCVYIPVKAEVTGDYIVKVNARGHVADKYKPSLNVCLYTLDDYYAENMPDDEMKTQQIAYDMITNSTYRWSIHMVAGQYYVLRYKFGTTGSAYSVDVAKTVIDEIGAFDKLSTTIAEAQALLDANATSKLVSEESRTQLSNAIAEAQKVSEDDAEDVIEAALETLEEEIANFKSNIATWQYPVADIQMRINNTKQCGNGAAFEVRNSSGSDRDNGFVGAMKFDISDLAGDSIISATLSLITCENGGPVAAYPFTSDFGEVGGTTDSYGAKQAYITEALSKEPYFTFPAKLGGGKKIFEWVASDTYQYTYRDWQVSLDATEALRSLVAAGDSVFSMLFAPASNSGSRTTILTKDVSADTYGNPDRWARVAELLAQDNSDVSVLYPTLVVEKKTATGIEQVVITQSAAAAAIVNVYSIDGRRVRSHVMRNRAFEGLPAGIYIVNGRKYIIR